MELVDGVIFVSLLKISTSSGTLTTPLSINLQNKVCLNKISHSDSTMVWVCFFNLCHWPSKSSSNQAALLYSTSHSIIKLFSHQEFSLETSALLFYPQCKLFSNSLSSCKWTFNKQGYTNPFSRITCFLFPLMIFYSNQNSKHLFPLISVKSQKVF